MSSSPAAVCSSCPTPAACGEHPVRTYPSSTSDAQWALLEPMLPPRSRLGRPEKHCRRLIVDAIFYLVRGGIQWRMLPAQFPPHQTVYGYYQRWTKAGAWEQITDTLRDRERLRQGRNPQPSAAIIDSQSVKAAETVARGSRGYDAGKKINGRKRHIAVDSLGLLITVVVTAASIQDRDGAIRLLAALRAKLSTITLVWADGGYAGRLVTWATSVLTLTVQIVKRSDDTTGFTVLPRRWIVERTLSWITRHRRCVRDYETRPDHHEAMVHLAMISTVSRRLTRAST